MRCLPAKGATQQASRKRTTTLREQQIRTLSCIPSTVLQKFVTWHVGNEPPFTLSRCRALQVFLPCLSHRFLRLSLQGIGRVGAWAGSKEVLALHPDDIVPAVADLSRCTHGYVRVQFVFWG